MEAREVAWIIAPPLGRRDWREAAKQKKGEAAVRTDASGQEAQCVEVSVQTSGLAPTQTFSVYARIRDSHEVRRFGLPESCPKTATYRTSIKWQLGAAARHEIFFDYIDVNWDAEFAGIRRSAYLAKPASQQSGRMQ